MAIETHPNIKIVDKRGEPKPIDYFRTPVSSRVRSGHWKPHGERLLVRAILAQDFTVVGGAGQADDERYKLEYDPRNAIAWEVIAVGGGCERWYEERRIPLEERVKAGDHIMHRSIVADRADINDLKCRFWWLHVEDVMGVDDDPRE